MKKSAVKIDEILAKYLAYADESGAGLIRRAHSFSFHAHVGQKRSSGEPFIDHPMHVALILTQLRLDAESIAAALLHDTVEDTKVKLEDIKENFGDEIAHIVDGVTKLSSVSFYQKHEAQAETFRKMLLAMAQDIRVIMIKLADRVHNMRTLNHLAEDKQRCIAQETVDIYAPLANRLGISWIKVELEETAFRYLKPMVFHNLNRGLNTTRKWREKFIKQVSSELKQHLHDHNIEGEVSGRHKHLYSICRKMEVRGLTFEEVSDILAFRILVDTLSKCYECLGVIHAVWKPIPGKFKDYIALPKINGYQSLHTTVIGPEGETVEIQIRTKEMHRVAEQGIAAHWMYKEGKASDDVKKFQWLRSIVDWQKDLEGSNEFLQTVKLDLFADQVYVFSPKGDVLELPYGSTPIDFAYRIHTDIGMKCSAARINGKIVPIRYKLQNGDRIEIITNENQKPNKDWLKFAVTSKAKAKIRAFLRTEERETGISMGRDMLEQELRKSHRNVAALIKSGDVMKVAETMNYRSEDDLLMAIGFGKAPLHKVASRIIGDDETKVAESDSTLLSRLVSKVSRKKSSTIKVGGLDDVLVRLGKCCNPIPGDPIVGFVTRGRGITVHLNTCPKILELSEDRRVDVEWAGKKTDVHVAKLRVFTKDLPGLLAKLTHAISSAGANIASAQISTTYGKKAVHTYNIQLKDTQQLLHITKLLEQVDGVISVERVRSG